MTELLFWSAWFGVASGFMLGWNRMLDILAMICTAGAAALAIHAVQAGLPDEALRMGATFGGIQIEAMAYLTYVATAMSGWMLGRWRRDVEGEEG